MENRIAFIKQLVLDASALIKERINHELEISAKNNILSDIVTNVDFEVEQFLVENIKKEFKEDSFLTEEKTVNEEINDNLWIIDPIDGTMNFVYFKKDFAISIAFYQKGIGQFGIVYDVMADEMFVGIKDQGVYVNDKKQEKLPHINLSQSIVDISLKTIYNLNRKDFKNLCNVTESVLAHRNLGSAALRICHIATNRAHLYLSDKLCVWDVAAGNIILQEAGGYHNFIDQKLPENSNRIFYIGANNKDIKNEFNDIFYKG